MRINEQKTYTMYLSVREFDTIYPITNSIPYSYRFEGNTRDEEGEYILVMTEDMLDDMIEVLEKEKHMQEYEDYDRIAYILNDLYYELYQ